MPILYNWQSKKVEFVPDENVQSAIGSGQYAFRSGARVPVTTPDGQAGTVDAGEAPSLLQQGWQYQTAAQARLDTQAKIQAVNAEAYDMPVTAALAGVARGATFGLSDVAMRAVGGESVGEGLRKVREISPIASTVGEIGGALASMPFGATPVGAVSNLGKSISTGLKSTEAIKSLAQAGKAGEVATKMLSAGAGSAVEGAFFGAGEVLTEAALGDPNLTAKNAAVTFGLNTLLGGAAGGLVEGVGMGFAKLKEKTAKIVLDDLNLPGKVGEKYADVLAKLRILNPEQQVELKELFNQKNRGWREQVMRYTDNPTALIEDGTKNVAALVDTANFENDFLKSIRQTSREELKKEIIEKPQQARSFVEPLVAKFDDTIKTTGGIIPPEVDLLGKETRVAIKAKISAEKELAKLKQSAGSLDGELASLRSQATDVDKNLAALDEVLAPEKSVVDDLQQRYLQLKRTQEASTLGLTQLDKKGVVTGNKVLAEIEDEYTKAATAYEKKRNGMLEKLQKEKDSLTASIESRNLKKQQFDIDLADRQKAFDQISAHADVSENRWSQVPGNLKSKSKSPEGYLTGAGADLAHVREVLIDELKAATNKADVFEAVLNARQRMDDAFSDLFKKSQMDISIPEAKTLSAIQGIRKEMQNVLHDNATFGVYAERFAKADQAFNYFIATNRNLQKNFFSKRPGMRGDELFLDENKVKDAFISPDRNPVKNRALDHFQDATKKISNAAAEFAEDPALSQLVGAYVEKTAGNIDNLKKIRSAQILMNQMESSTGKALYGYVLGSALASGGLSLDARDSFFAGVAGAALANPRMALRYLVKLERGNIAATQAVAPAVKKFLGMQVPSAAGDVISGIKPVTINQLVKQLGEDDSHGATDIDSIKTKMERLGDPGYTDLILAKSNPGLDQVAPETYAGLAQNLQRAAEFVLSKAPVEAPGDLLAGRTRYSKTQEASLQAYAQAAFQPGVIFDELRRGRIKPETVETISALYPELHSQLQVAAIESLTEKSKDIRYSKKLELAKLLGIPTTPALANFNVLQSAYVEEPPQMPAKGNMNPTTYSPGPSDALAGRRGS